MADAGGAAATTHPLVIVVTGCSGRVGLAATEELVIGVDVVERPHFSGSRFVKCDITDASAIKDAVTGADAVVHLAAVPDDAPFAEHLVPANVVGAGAVIEAVRATPSVRRLLVASSGKIYSGYVGPTPIEVDTPPQPTCMYSATKLFAEAAALALANNCPQNAPGGGGLHVIVPRLGWMPRTREDVDAMAKITSSGGDGVNSYFSPGDAGRFVAVCMESKLDPEKKHILVYAQSLPQHGSNTRFSLRAARDLLSWEPVDRFPEGIDDILGDSDYHSHPGLFQRVLSSEQQAAAAATAATS